MLLWERAKRLESLKSKAMSNFLGDRDCLFSWFLSTANFFFFKTSIHFCFSPPVQDYSRSIKSLSYERTLRDFCFPPKTLFVTLLVWILMQVKFEIGSTPTINFVLFHLFEVRDFICITSTVLFEGLAMEWMKPLKLLTKISFVQTNKI